MRYERKHGKKKRRIRWSSIFLLLFLLAGGMALYTYFQYKAGYNESSKTAEQEQEEY